MATFKSNAFQTATATVSLVVLLTGCAVKVAGPMTQQDVIRQECADEAYKATEGIRTATYVTTVLGLILWPALIIPAVLGGVALSQEGTAREECLARRLDTPAAPMTPAAALPEPVTTEATR